MPCDRSQAMTDEQRCLVVTVAIGFASRHRRSRAEVTRSQRRC